MYIKYKTKRFDPNNVSYTVKFYHIANILKVKIQVVSYSVKDMICYGNCILTNVLLNIFLIVHVSCIHVFLRVVVLINQKCIILYIYVAVDV